MLPAGATAEIIAGDEHRGVAVGRLVENEAWHFFTGGFVVAHFIEEIDAKPGAFDGFEKLFGDDHVGVDIDHVQRGSDAFEFGEWFHDWSQIMRRAGLVPVRWPERLLISFAHEASIGLAFLRRWR